MNRQYLLRVIGFSVAMLLILVGATTSMGQGPDPADTPEPIEASPGGSAAAAEISIAAQAPFTLNYQGFLTDGSGTPLQGTQTLTFTLHDAQTLGTQVWGPETHTTNLVNGLFSLVLGETQVLTPAIFNRALFLQINVNGVSLDRQPLRPVAYAFGLVPGAEVKGDPLLGSQYALTVNNTDTASGNSGLYVEGQQYAIVAAQRSALSDVAIFSPDFVEAQGYKSADPSYWWTPGMSGVAATPGNLTLTTSIAGTAVLNSAVAGGQKFYLPISLPSQLYGQEVSVKELTLYYYTSNSASFIDSIRMDKLTGANTSTTLINNGTDLVSTTPTSTTLTTTGAYTLTSAAGPLNVELNLNFANTGDTIFVGGIRLKLEHKD